MSINVFDTLRERGFVQQVTDEEALKKLFSGAPATAYIGYDLTADSLHVGNLFTLMAVKHLENAGHRIVVIAGGGTTMIGDPSGKTEMRQMLSSEQIDQNLTNISAQITTILDRERTVIVNNADWLLPLRYVDFLRDIGRHFSVNKMLTAESARARLERGLNFIEFNYQILQAYDFVELCRRYDCRLQIGGDDQWGNILAGVDLCRRVLQKEVQGLTIPLLMNAAGQKMGKTADGAVWLDPQKVSPYAYYQYWVNVHDEDVARLLGYYTFLPMLEVNAVRALAGGPELNAAKSILAYEATRILHGSQAATQAHTAALGAFGTRSLPEDLLPSSDVVRQAQGHIEEVPTTILHASELTDGVLLADLMVRCGHADSKKNARRLIEQGGVKLNENKVVDVQQKISLESMLGQELILRTGKKHVHRFKF
jgi:tyrosyl-tRNA synthetase